MLVPRLTLASALFAALLATSTISVARPVVVEPSTTLVNPDAANWPAWGGIAATNGEWLLVLGGNYESISDLVRRAAFLYRRVAGQWQYQGLLDQSLRESGSYQYPSEFALQGDRAIIELDGTTTAWRIVNGAWQKGAVVGGITEDIELDGENFVTTTGDCSWDGQARDSNGAGGWTTTYLNGQPRGCDDEFWGGEADRLGNYIVLATSDTFDLEPQEVPIFERISGAWQRRILIPVPTGNTGFNEGVALVPQSNSVSTGVEAILGAADGAYSFDLRGVESPYRLQAADAYQAAATNTGINGAVSTIEYVSGLIFVRERSADRGVNVINVYRGDHYAGYEHVAVLAAANGRSLGTQFDVAASTTGIVVVANDTSSFNGASNVNNTGDVYVFSLPANFTTTPERYDDFQDGVADGWSSIGTSQFSVATSGTNRFYRQGNIAGEARALTGSSTRDQSIEADVKPTAFGCPDCWVGLVTRYQDAANYYYVTLRNSGQVHLRRMRNGSYVELARASVPVTAGRNYRLRLESVGSVHKVYLDGQPLLDVDDGTWAGPGRAGVTMYRAQADYDNVIVTPSARATIFRNNFADYTGNWKFSGSGQWQRTTSGVFAQNSIGAEARALIGPPLTDQVVRARLRPIAYASGNAAQERWSGLIARHVDDSNYYYVTLRTSNQLSLRKLVNGSIVTLGTVPLTVSLNSVYDVKLEAVGDQLRVFVGGQLRLQAQDGSHARGRGGLMTYKAAVHYDDYLAYQP